MINSDSFNIPKTWDQITVGQFIELNTIDLTQFESEFYLNLEKLAIVTNTSADDECWEEMDVIELSNIIKTSEFLFSAPANKFKTKLENGFILKTFNDLTLGEFIDIEYFIQDNVIINFTKILSIIYRKHRIGDWNEVIMEPYSVIDINTRSQEFEDISISSVFGIIDAYAQFKNDFVTKYSALFEPEIDEESDIEKYGDLIDEQDPIAQKELEDEKKIEEKQKKWAWEKLLFGIAQGDMIKINQVTQLGLVYVFNMLAMRKELGITD
jgi:hypothetical protein